MITFDATLATLSRDDHILVFLYTLRIHQCRGMAIVETYGFGLKVVVLLVGVDVNDKLQYKFHIIHVVLLGTCRWIL